MPEAQRHPPRVCLPHTVDPADRYLRRAAADPAEEPDKGDDMRKQLATSLATAAVLWFALALPTAAADPGTGTAATGPKAAIAANSLNQFTTIVGKVVLSEDACGTNAFVCTVDILKPSATATVREAHLFCATTGFTGHVPQNGEVTVNAAPVAWDATIPNGIQSYNSRDDVTSIVKPVGDAAPPGLVSFRITENPTTLYDGCALKVIWDDPTTTTNSILIFWGAQEPTGDTFVITFAPLQPTAFVDPLEFSLGISFGAQGLCRFGPLQFSQVDVNSTRLTTSAGGEDDGSCANGALITLGGTGDTAVNPPPAAPPTSNPSIPDDELYDLRPFLNPGDTSMTIFTLNPSRDDNIFLANLFLRNVEVVPPTPVPTTLTLDPPAATNPVGTKHCVTATVRDQFTNPMAGVTVRFSVAGSVTTTGSATTDANGEAQFCYTGPTAPGADKIHAYADTDGDNTQDADEPFGDAAKTWVPGEPARLTLTPKTATNPVDSKHCVTATVTDAFGNPTPGITVRFSVMGSVTTSGSVKTDANGQAQFCYIGPPLPGADKIHAYADTDNDNFQDATEPFDDATKAWVLPISTPGCEVKITNGGWIIAQNGDKSSFGGNARADGAGNASGNEEYQDHGPADPFNFHGNVLVVVCDSATSATIYGQASIDGAGSLYYRLRVEDNNEPGTGYDKYWLLIANGYDSGNQVLKGGNVQIHKS
jgi:hypothetical protein